MHRPRNRALKRLYGNYTREIGEIWSREMRCGHPSLSRPTCPRLPSKPAACLPAWLPGCFFALTLRFVSVRPIVRLPSPLPRVQVVLPLLRDLAWKGTARRIFDDPDNGPVHRGFNVDFFGRPRRSGTIDCYKVMRRDFTYEDFRRHPSL